MSQDAATCRCQMDAIQTPPEITTNFFYLRFIDDRNIDEKDFGKIQKDRQTVLEKWAKRVKGLGDSVKFGIVAANNHYAGFGPATANSFQDSRAERRDLASSASVATCSA